MKIKDEITISLQAGKGGDGCCSFRRERYVPLGGPDGGDGGEGGNIYLIAKKNIPNFLHFKYKSRYFAQDGDRGYNKNCTGSKGEDLYLNIPIGTKIFDYKTKELIYDIYLYDQKFLIVKGGAKGFGNLRFKNSVNRSPKKTTKGKNGQNIYFYI